MVACVGRRLSRPHQISGRNGSACRAATRWMQTDPWMLQLQSGKGAPDLACTLGGIQTTHACSRHACSTSSGSPSPTAANAMQLRGMKGGGTATGAACTTRPGGRLRSRNVFLLFQGRTKRKIHQFFEPPLTSCVPTNDRTTGRSRSTASSTSTSLLAGMLHPSSLRLPSVEKNPPHEWAYTRSVGSGGHASPGRSQPALHSPKLVSGELRPWLA